MLFSQTVWSFWTCTGEGVINLGLTIIWIWLAFASSKIRWIHGYMPALFNISQAVTSCNSLLQALSTAAPPRTTASNRWLWSFYLLSMFFFFSKSFIWLPKYIYNIIFIYLYIIYTFLFPLRYCIVERVLSRSFSYSTWRVAVSKKIQIGSNRPLIKARGLISWHSSAPCHP